MAASIKLLLIYDILSVAFFCVVLGFWLLAEAIVGTHLENTTIGDVSQFFFSLSIFNLMTIASFFFMLIVLFAAIYLVLYLPAYLNHSFINGLLRDLKSENPQVRKSAIIACGNKRLLIAEDDLTSILLTDPEVDLRLCAFNALKLMDRHKLDLVLQTLDETPDVAGRIQIVRLLGLMRSEVLIDVLADAYQKNPDTGVRMAVLDAISPLNSKRVTGFIIDMINVRNPRGLKLKMLDMLHRYDFINFVEPLIGLLKIETDLEVRLQIFAILADVGDMRCVEVFIAALNDSDIAVRDFAAATLKALGITHQAAGTIREIVKVPCKYCGSLVEVTCRACASCGAPLNPYKN